jgi:ElaB/YqjD/DUF883 family membrane-anchored ribosome-binding protein
MTTANQAFRQAVNSPAAHHAAETARSLGEEVSDFAADVSRKAGKQFDRAKDRAADLYDEAHEATVQNPHISLAVALGLGFLLGAMLVRRR